MSIPVALRVDFVVSERREDVTAGRECTYRWSRVDLLLLLVSAKPAVLLSTWMAGRQLVDDRFEASERGLCREGCG